MQSVVKVLVYIVGGAVVVSLFQSAETAKAIKALTGGFANVLSAMKGQSSTQPSAANQPAPG